MDLLDLGLQKVEEITQSWASTQQKFTILQGEVAMIKSTEIDLLTTMQHLDSMLQKVIPSMEQA